MYGYVDDVAPEYFGQATDSGQYDDVETFGPSEVFGGTGVTSISATRVAVLFVAVALAGLWLMGAGVFKGSNHS